MQSGLGMMYDFISPAASRLHDPDPVDQVILDNKISVSWPQRMIGGVKLKPAEYSRYSEIAGKLAKEQLDQLVRNPGFKQMSEGPEGMKAELVKRVISQSRKAAGAMVRQEFEELNERIVLRSIEKQQNLAGGQNE
jgi:hypothetical protein